MRRLGVITGLASEADIFAALPSEQRPVVRIAGASAARAEAAALKLLGEGCAAILSFGVAGGLDPALRPGTVVIADAIVTADSRHMPTDATWRDAVLRALDGSGPLATGTIYGSDAPLLDVEAKKGAFDKTGAIAVDMESHGAARAAALKGMPFLAIRAVADGASQTIPPWVMDAILPDGGLAPEKIARALLPRPWMVWGLIGLARANGRALGALGRVALRLGPGLGFAG